MLDLRKCLEASFGLLRRGSKSQMQRGKEEAAGGKAKAPREEAAEGVSSPYPSPLCSTPALLARLL